VGRVSHVANASRDVQLLMRGRHTKNVVFFIASLAVATPAFLFGAWAGLTKQRFARAYMPDGYHVAVGVGCILSLAFLWYALTVHLALLLRFRPVLCLRNGDDGVVVIGPAGRRRLIGTKVTMSTGGGFGPFDNHFVRIKGSQGVYHLRVFGPFDHASLSSCEGWLDSLRSATP